MGTCFQQEMDTKQGNRSAELLSKVVKPRKKGKQDVRVKLGSFKEWIGKGGLAAIQRFRGLGDEQGTHRGPGVPNGMPMWLDLHACELFVRDGSLDGEAAVVWTPLCQSPCTRSMCLVGAHMTNQYCETKTKTESLGPSCYNGMGISFFWSMEWPVCSAPMGPGLSMWPALNRGRMPYSICAQHNRT